MPPDLQPSALQSVIDQIPAGRWGIAVSGGADSVALLRLAAARADLTLNVLHLNHELRGAASGGDAAFIVALAARLGLPATASTRSAIEQSIDPQERESLPANLSSRYRRLRLALYRQAADEHGLDGILLAHHADDQAETVLFRLLRGGGYAGLAGMAEQSQVMGLTLLRPLLSVRRDLLRDYLQSIDQPWREDASNASDDYARNRIRKVLRAHPALVAPLLAMAAHCRALSEWVDRHAPVLREQFSTTALADQPQILAAAAAARWLAHIGLAADAVSPTHVQAIIQMAADAAAPPAHALPGGLRVRRRAKRIFIDPAKQDSG